MEQDPTGVSNEKQKKNEPPGQWMGADWKRCLEYEYAVACGFKVGIYDLVCMSCEEEEKLRNKFLLARYLPS